MGLLLQGTGFGEIVTCRPPPDGAGCGLGAGAGAAGAGAGAGGGAGAGLGAGDGDGVADGAVGEGSTLPQVDVAMAAVARNTVNSQIRGTLDEVFSMDSPSKANSFHTLEGCISSNAKRRPKRTSGAAVQSAPEIRRVSGGWPTACG